MISPMLAHRYRDHSSKLTYPLAVQPKLNGLRAIYHDGNFYSRDRHQWNPAVVEHLTTQLSHIHPNIYLDGELYVHGWSLQKINSAISVNRHEPTPQTPSIQYHIFDLAYPDPFKDRLKILTLLRGANIVPVQTYICETPDEADTYFSTFKRAGYEGIMYRQLNAPYGFSHLCSNKENRWACLQKRKDFMSSEFPILGIEQGHDISGNPKPCVGALRFCTPSGIPFTAGSGLTESQRLSFWTSPPIGRLATVQYEMLSDGGCPLKPTIALVHDTNTRLQ